MSCITDITNEYRQKKISLDEVIRRLLLCDEAKGIAKVCYLKRKHKLYVYAWEDILDSTVGIYARYLDKEQKGEVDKQGKPIRIDNPRAYFRAICKSICSKLVKKEVHGPISIFEVFYQLASSDGRPNIYEKLIYLLKAFGFPCGRLLFLYYLEEPPIKEYEELYNILAKEAEESKIKLRVNGWRGIPNLLTRCRNSFGDFLRGRDDLDDLFND